MLEEGTAGIFRDSSEGLMYRLNETDALASGNSHSGVASMGEIEMPTVVQQLSNASSHSGIPLVKTADAQKMESMGTGRAPMSESFQNEYRSELTFKRCQVMLGATSRERGFVPCMRKGCMKLGIVSSIMWVLAAAVLFANEFMDKLPAAVIDVVGFAAIAGLGYAKLLTDSTDMNIEIAGRKQAMNRILISGGILKGDLMFYERKLSDEGDPRKTDLSSSVLDLGDVLLDLEASFYLLLSGGNESRQSIFWTLFSVGGKRSQEEANAKKN